MNDQDIGVEEFSNVKLQEELQRHICEVPLGNGTMKALKHPLVYCIPYGGTGFENHFNNKFFEQKKKSINIAIKKNDYSQFVILHERPYRLEAFMKLNLNKQTKEFWELLGFIWVDSENIYQYKHIWMNLFSSPPKASKFFMSKEDRQTLSELTCPIEIYRGANFDGLSYTIDLEKAKWFSNRFNLKGKIFKRIAMPEEIFAMVGKRGENEVIITPEFLQSKNGEII